MLFLLQTDTAHSKESELYIYTDKYILYYRKMSNTVLYRDKTIISHTVNQIHKIIALDCSTFDRDEYNRQR